MAKIKVACVGDSITAGSGNTYPMQLQILLGEDYDVRNFGRGGAPVRHETENSYTVDENYLASLEFNPDIVLFMLGTNDVWDGNYPEVDNYFKRDYKWFINSFAALEAKPKIYLATSPTGYNLHFVPNDRVNVKIRNMQFELAEELGLPIIDMNTLTASNAESFPDGIHGNDSGYLIIAQNWYKYVFGGKLSHIKIRTEPEARVVVGGYLKKADIYGVADIEISDGVKTVDIIKDDFVRIHTEITVNGDGVFSIPMEKGQAVLSNGCKATCSSDQSGNTADKAFDGDKANTRWESLTEDPSWIYVDLGQKQLIGSVRIYWEGAFACNYEIAVSDDGENWQTVKEIKGAVGGITQDDFAPISARFVKMTGTERGTMFAYSLYEMQVLSAE